MLCNHRMQTQSKKIPSQVPQSQKTALPFAWLPIGLSISPQKFHRYPDQWTWQCWTTMSRTLEWYCPQLEDIPELETDEENWNDSQFDDAELLYNHNSTEEGNRICCEYLAYFEKVKDQQYSPYHTMQALNIIFLSQIIITKYTTKTVPETAKSKCILTPTALYQGHTYMVW